MHPFRFAATMPAPASPLADWHSELRHLEDLGLSSVVAADHSNLSSTGVSGETNQDAGKNEDREKEPVSRLRFLRGSNS